MSKSPLCTSRYDAHCQNRGEKKQVQTCKLNIKVVAIDSMGRRELGAHSNHNWLHTAQAMLVHTIHTIHTIHTYLQHLQPTRLRSLQESPTRTCTDEQLRRGMLDWGYQKPKVVLSKIRKRRIHIYEKNFKKKERRE